MERQGKLVTFDEEEQLAGDLPPVLNVAAVASAVERLRNEAEATWLRTTALQAYAGKIGEEDIAARHKANRQYQIAAELAAHTPAVLAEDLPPELRFATGEEL